MRRLIVLDAAPFCYGPISTLLSVVDHLRTENVDLVMLVSGTSAEMAADYSGDCECLECDTDSIADLERHEELLQRCDVFVSNTNPMSAAWARCRGLRVAYIDTLFWMWNRIDPVVAAANLYVVQDFEGVSENRERIGSEIRNLKIVGPLISSRNNGHNDPENTCLISFGGIESHLTIPGKTNRYPWVMTEVLLEVFRRIPKFDRYVFRGRGHVMRSLAADFGRPDVEFGFAPHREFLDELRRCRSYFVSPGLTGIFEAMDARTATVFLAPQNYSQQLQAETFQSDGRWSLPGIAWHQIYEDFSLPRHMDEALAVATLNETIRRFERDEKAQARYADLLTPLARDLKQSPPLPYAQTGASNVAGMILELAQSERKAESAHAH
jgi:hypothetical protein